MHPKAVEAERAYIAQVEQHNAMLARGGSGAPVSDLGKRALYEAKRLFPELTARDEALKADALTHQVTYPRPLVMKQPDYPVGSLYLGTRGTVYVAFVIGTDGRPRDIHILFNPEKRMAKAVLLAMQEWRFTPALIDGIPSSMSTVLPVEFALQ